MFKNIPEDLPNSGYSLFFFYIVFEEPGFVQYWYISDMPEYARGVSGFHSVTRIVHRIIQLGLSLVSSYH